MTAMNGHAVKRTNVRWFDLESQCETELHTFVKSFFTPPPVGVSQMYKTKIDQSDGLGDRDTADIFTEISRGTDKYLWFVEAHLG